MGQVLHGSAKTTHAVRAAIQRSQASVKELSERYSLNPKTVRKWKKRDFIDDAAMGPDLGGWAFHQQAAEIEHGDLVAQGHDRLHVVLDQQDRDAAVADPAHQVHHVPRLFRVHARERLVEQQELRIGRQGDRHAEGAL